MTEVDGLTLGNEGVISLATHSGGRFLGTGVTWTSTANWPTANRAYYIPFVVRSPVIVTKLAWCNGNAASGNVDTGIYRARDSKLLVSTGSTARSGTNTLQGVSVTPTFLQPGLYFFGHASDTTTNSRTVYWSSGIGINDILTGMKMEESAFPLPATATPVAATGTGVWFAVVAYTSKSGY